MSIKLKDLFPKGANLIDFEEAFKKELLACYAEASRSSEAGDDRQVVVSLAQARVWERLLNLVSGK